MKARVLVKYRKTTAKLILTYFLRENTLLRFYALKSSLWAHCHTIIIFKIVVMEIIKHKKPRSVVNKEKRPRKKNKLSYQAFYVKVCSHPKERP